MGCSSCGSGAPQGCGDKGHCTSGGCNKSNSFDWIAMMDIYDPSGTNIVEVSFKEGSRKEFYINSNTTGAITGDMVVVETTSGLDVGKISLSGELVKLQMKKKKTSEDRVTLKVIRKAHKMDLIKLDEARAMERPTLVRARVIARTLGLDMKIGDIEYQGDKKKATFYYTADGRVDFRELVRSYAGEFRIKVEMRQIGARQESARIGGIGSCGRELCCSTWLSDFKSVNTSAARYQNIAINQTKLSGQCGRLKCCLNYELDTYLDALKDFPKSADNLKTKKGKAILIKTDIFKGLMFYIFEDIKFRGPIVTLTKERVKVILEMNSKGQVPDDLMDKEALLFEESKAQKEIEFADVTGEIELPNIKKKRRKSRNKRRKNPNQSNSNTNNSKGGNSNSKSGNANSRNNNSNQSKNSGSSKNNNQNKNQNKNSNTKNTNQNSNQGSNDKGQKANSGKPKSDSNNNNRNKRRNNNRRKSNNRPNNQGNNNQNNNNQNNSNKKDSKS